MHDRTRLEELLAEADTLFTQRHPRVLVFNRCYQGTLDEAFASLRDG
jgi:hypothetical protein